MSLEMTCERCAVAPKCPKKGASPMFFGQGKRVHCRIVGGYGRVPVDPTILSAESKERMEKDGPCLTIAEVPVMEDGNLMTETVKVFHGPVIGDRERPTAVLDSLIPKHPGG